LWQATKISYQQVVAAFSDMQLIRILVSDLMASHLTIIFFKDAPHYTTATQLHAQAAGYLCSLFNDIIKMFIWAAASYHH